MSIQERVTELINQQYIPADSMADSTIETTTVRLFDSVSRLYCSATLDMVEKSLAQLGFKAWDRGDLDFVWLMKERPLLAAAGGSSSLYDIEGVVE